MIQISRRRAQAAWIAMRIKLKLSSIATGKATDCDQDQPSPVPCFWQGGYLAMRAPQQAPETALLVNFQLMATQASSVTCDRGCNHPAAADHYEIWKRLTPY